MGAALPLTREAFRDTRYRLDWEHALLTAFVLIPVGTVLLEEIAFRGVLWGLLRRVRGGGTVIATIVSSVLFGLMHGRWLAGTLAGIVYALVVRRRGQLGDAIVAHAVTNLLIAEAVLLFGAWWLW